MAAQGRRVMGHDKPAPTHRRPAPKARPQGVQTISHAAWERIRLAIRELKPLPRQRPQ